MAIQRVSSRKAAAPPEVTKSERRAAMLRSIVVGQDEPLEFVMPFVELFEAGLSSEERPAGAFFLAGPTGTGKTRTVEALAEVLHGSAKNVLRVDCGEFQMEHEVAKLIGAPPGYLGHRETQPMLSQQKLSSVASERSALSLVLFDEIEKAAPSMTRLLLGMLDRGVIRMGDGTVANFGKSLVFFTTNLGSAAANRGVTSGGFGFSPRSAESKAHNMSYTTAALKKRFSPEFLNRIDRTVVYSRLTEEHMRQILEIQLGELQRRVDNRFSGGFTLELNAEAKSLLVELGTSPEYGARELKRVINAQITTRIARVMHDYGIPAGSVVRGSVKDGEIVLKVEAGE